MDLSMPGIDGIEGTARLRDSGEEARVVVLTSFVEHERVTAAPVSYTHLDVYKRQHWEGGKVGADGAQTPHRVILTPIAQETYDWLLTSGVMPDFNWLAWPAKRCLLYTSRCV